jgi:hypothetical protein
MWEQFNEALRQTTSRVIVGVVDFLPGILAMLAAVAIALLIAQVCGFILRRSLTKLRFDERLGQWGFGELADLAPYGSATVFISRLAVWTIVALGFLVGLTALNASLASAVTLRVINYLPNLIVATAILIAGSFISRFLARSVAISATNMQIHSARLIGLGVKWLILVLASAMALDQLGVGGDIVKMAFGIAFGGIVLAMALAVGLGSKDVVSRSWERHEEKEKENEEEQPLRHL